MSQPLPQPPLATPGESSQPFGGRVLERRREKLSSLAVASLALGIVAFVPLGMRVNLLIGAGAFVTGILGIRAMNDARYKGRALAMTGLVLGASSLLFWALGGGGVWGVLPATAAPRQMAASFIRDLSLGDVDSAKSKAGPLLSRARCEELARTIEPWGKLSDVASSNVRMESPGGSAGKSTGRGNAELQSCEIAGTAQFADGPHTFEMNLAKNGETWTVTALSFR